MRLKGFIEVFVLIVVLSIATGIFVIFKTRPGIILLKQLSTGASLNPIPSTNQSRWGVNGGEANLSERGRVGVNLAPEPTSESDTILIGEGTYQVTGNYSDGGEVENLLVPMTLEISYSSSEKLDFTEVDLLRIYHWDAARNKWIALPTELNKVSKNAKSTTNALGLFSLRATPTNLKPVIVSVSPSTIKSDQETEITISGTTFLPTPFVNLGKGAEAGGLKVFYVSSSTLKAIISGFGPGTYDLFIQNPDGQESTLPNAITVLPPSP